MELVNELFLDALGASLQKKTVLWEESYTPDQWVQLFAVASSHHVLPMVYEAVVHSPSACKADSQIFAAAKKQTMQLVMLQTVKTNAFLLMMKTLISAGLTPLVVKGIVCRELYPYPDYRISSDEDVIIPEEQFALCHEMLLKHGMELADPSIDLNAHEILYVQREGKMLIDLHNHLFPTEWEAYDAVNRCFEGVHQRAVIQTIQGVPLFTMNYTEHLFFLISHSFKHFIGSGFGIRQVCDICLFANAYGAQIDWVQVMALCEEIRADLFAVALFRIGEKYLNFQPENACYPTKWKNTIVDEKAMLDDLLEAGVYGKSSVSRRYSYHLTLRAVSNLKKEKKSGNSIFKVVFPSAEYLADRYHYLKDRPYLLPIAWADRILKYSKETVAGSHGNSAAESLKIGNQRIELLRQYGIID